MMDDDDICMTCDGEACHDDEINGHELNQWRARGFHGGDQPTAALGDLKVLDRSQSEQQHVERVDGDKHLHQIVHL